MGLNRLLFSFISTSTLFFIFTGNLSEAAPSVCRSCTKNCSSGLEEELSLNSIDGQVSHTEALLVEGENGRNETIRRRRNVNDGISKTPCNSFSIEMILIPLSIAMIPIGLCALLLCTCCCGPEENRGKLPDNFLKAAMGSKAERLDSEDFELEYKDGYVQRKDSSKTKFSTVVSVIEHRRNSAWSITTNASIELPIESENQSGDAVIENKRKLTKIPSTGSMVRFSDQVSVLGIDELPRR